MDQPLRHLTRCRYPLYFPFFINNTRWNHQHRCYFPRFPFVLDLQSPVAPHGVAQVLADTVADFMGIDKASLPLRPDRLVNHNPRRVPFICRPSQLRRDDKPLRSRYLDVIPS